jgi:hypothetical protein
MSRRDALAEELTGLYREAGVNFRQDRHSLPLHS